MNKTDYSKKSKSPRIKISSNSANSHKTYVESHKRSIKIKKDNLTGLIHI